MRYSELITGRESFSKKSGADIWYSLPVWYREAVLSALFKNMPWGDTPLEVLPAMGEPELKPAKERLKYYGTGWWLPVQRLEELVIRAISMLQPETDDPKNWVAQHINEIGTLVKGYAEAMQIEAEKSMKKLPALAGELEQSIRELSSKLKSSITLPGFTADIQVGTKEHKDDSWRPIVDTAQYLDRWELIVSNWLKPYVKPEYQKKVASLLLPFVAEGFKTKSQRMEWAITEAFRKLSTVIKSDWLTEEGQAMLHVLFPDLY